MNQAPLEIVVDDREARHSRVTELLEENPAIRITRKRLRVGDYIILGRVIAERKRIPDFLASLRDGRLFRQARALANCGLRGLMILEGHGNEWDRVGVQRAAIQGAMRAQALLKKFDNIERIITASELELCTIDGIGPQTEAAIRDAVKEEISDYRYLQLK